MESTQKYPPQIKYIVGNEAAERYSFYGMRSILTAFMVSSLLMTQEKSVAVYHVFVAMAYFAPLLGAYLSDRYWGKYNTIMRLSVVYCIGHLILALFETEIGLYAGLALICLGAGGIKPCVSAHVGDQFKSSQKELLEKVFSLFYWMINFGSVFSTLITPWTYQHYGSQVAFGIPGILMILATLVFWLGRHHYVHVPPQGKNPHSFGKIMLHGIGGFLSGKGFRTTAGSQHPIADVEAAVNICKLMMLYIWISVFWGLFDQSGSTWILQGNQMVQTLFGYSVSPSQMQALNPFLVLILIPIFTKGIYPAFRKIGFTLSPQRKMVGGMFITAISFASVAIIQQWIEKGEQVSIGWQLLPYIIITIAEVLISITGLEFAYTQAPRAMKSTIMSLWFLTVFVGNFLTAYLTKLALYPTASAGYFWQFAGIMFVVSVIFWIFSRFYKLQNYMEGA